MIDSTNFLGSVSGKIIDKNGTEKVIDYKNAVLAGNLSNIHTTVLSNGSDT